MTQEGRDTSGGLFLRAGAGLLLAIAAFRLFLCTRYLITPDEAYYWLWSQFPDWCYFSKGPLVAWTIWLGTALGGDTPFGVRWPSVLLHAATGFVLLRWTHKLYGARAAWVAVLSASCVPLFAIGGVLMTIDPLSVFFWAAAAAAGWEAWSTNKKQWWLLAGFLIGCGYLAKFTNAIQGLCFGLFLTLTPEGRQRLRQPGPWMAAVVALLMTLPFWIWNWQHDWVTWGHLKHRGALDRPFHFSVSELVQFITMQAVVFSPLLWIGWLSIAAMRVREVVAVRAAGMERELYLLCQSLPLIAFFAAFALNDAGQPNWTVPGYCALVVLGAGWFAARPEIKWLRYFGWAALAFGLAMTVVLHDTSWLKLPAKSDPLTRVRGWDQLAVRAEAEREKIGASFVLSNNYQIAAALTWHTPGDRTQGMAYCARNPGRIQNQFDFWGGYESFVGQDALFVSTQKGTPSHLRAQFEKVESLGDPFWIEVNGVPQHRFRFFKCTRLIGSALSPSESPEDAEQHAPQ